MELYLYNAPKLSADQTKALLKIFLKFGESFIIAHFLGIFKIRILLSVLRHIPNVKTMILQGSLTSTKTFINNSNLTLLTKLENLTLTMLENTFAYLFEGLPHAVLKTLIIRGDPTDFSGMIAQQPNIDYLRIYNDDDNFIFPPLLFNDLQLTRLKVSIDREDNQGNYWALQEFIRSQHTLKSLNFYHTRINGEVFIQMANLTELENLEVNISFVEPQYFREIARILKKLKKLIVYSTVDFVRAKEIVSLLGMHSMPNLERLELRLGHRLYEPFADFQKIGANSPNLKLLVLQACWSYELLYVIFKNFKKLQVFKAMTTGSFETNDSDDEDNSEDINGNVLSLYKEGLENPNLEILNIAGGLQSELKMYKFIHNNFPNLKELNVNWSHHDDSEW